MWAWLIASIALGSEDPAPLDVQGRKHVDDVIAEDLRSIQACYQRELTDRPDLVGHLRVHFTIASDGSVVGEEVLDSCVGLESLERCVLDRFRAMQFGPVEDDGTVIVTYPFVFGPGFHPPLGMVNVERALAPCGDLGAGHVVARYEVRGRRTREVVVVHNTAEGEQRQCVEESLGWMRFDRAHKRGNFVRMIVF